MTIKRIIKSGENILITCSKCGTQLRPQAKFCHKCGIMVVKEEPRKIKGKAYPKKRPPSSPVTGTSYVDRCLTLQYEELTENRNFNDLPEIQKVAHLGNAGQIDEAMQLAKSLLSKYSDLDLVYIRLEILYGKQGAYDDARTILKEGLKKCKRKSFLCDDFGVLELKARNLPEAEYWWVQSVLLQKSMNKLSDYTSFLYLAYVAHFFSLDHIASRLFQVVDTIRPEQTRLSGKATTDIDLLVRSQGTESMQKVLVKLYDLYPFAKLAS